MCSEELKDLQQRASIGQERHQKRSTQLDEFQDIGRLLEVKAVAALQAVQEGKNIVDSKEEEENLVNKDLLNCWDVSKQVKLQF